MAMSVGGDSAAEKPMSDINTTPLVDVMLVLLIIFLIAVPVAIKTVKGITLPVVTFDPTTTKPENVLLSVKGDGAGQCQVYWQTSMIGHEELLSRAVDKLKTEIARQGGVGNPDLELPEVHIRSDVDTPWRCVAGAIYNMQMAGFAKVGFISKPESVGGA